jgi:hypothetical protein
MQTLRASSSTLRFAGSSMDERKADWCSFITQEGEAITIGLPSERFVEYRNQYGCDLELVCRLALEQLDQWPSNRPYKIESKIYLKLEATLKNYEFRKADLVESTVQSNQPTIEGLTRHLNRLHGNGWEYFYTECYPRTGETDGSRYVFSRMKNHATV